MCLPARQAAYTLLQQWAQGPSCTSAARSTLVLALTRSLHACAARLAAHPQPAALPPLAQLQLAAALDGASAGDDSDQRNEDECLDPPQDAPLLADGQPSVQPNVQHSEAAETAAAETAAAPSGASCATTCPPASAADAGDSQSRVCGTTTPPTDMCDEADVHRALLRAQAAVLGVVLDPAKVAMLLGVTLDAPADCAVNDDQGIATHEGELELPGMEGAAPGSSHGVGAAVPPQPNSVNVDHPTSALETTTTAVNLAATVVLLLRLVTGSTVLLDTIQPTMDRPVVVSLLASVHMPLQDLSNAATRSKLVRAVPVAPLDHDAIACIMDMVGQPGILSPVVAAYLLAMVERSLRHTAESGSEHGAVSLGGDRLLAVTVRAARVASMPLIAEDAPCPAIASALGVALVDVLQRLKASRRAKRRGGEERDARAGAKPPKRARRVQGERRDQGEGGERGSGDDREGCLQWWEDDAGWEQYIATKEQLVQDLLKDDVVQYDPLEQARAEGGGAHEAATRRVWF